MDSPKWLKNKKATINQKKKKMIANTFKML